MHKPVMSQADACTYCIGSKVSSLSRIYLYSSYFCIEAGNNEQRLGIIIISVVFWFMLRKAEIELNLLNLGNVFEPTYAFHWLIDSFC
jgi:hypothetical protein